MYGIRRSNRPWALLSSFGRGIVWWCFCAGPSRAFLSCAGSPPAAAARLCLWHATTHTAYLYVQHLQVKAALCDRYQKVTVRKVYHRLLRTFPSSSLSHTTTRFTASSSTGTYYLKIQKLSWSKIRHFVCFSSLLQRDLCISVYILEYFLILWK